MIYSTIDIVIQWTDNTTLGEQKFRNSISKWTIVCSFVFIAAKIVPFLP